MKSIARLTAIATNLPEANVSTDIISPSYLYLGPRSDYANGLFAPWRYGPDGQEAPDFPLNKPGHRNAQILLTGPNFGCGSSREIAVWCLQDYGIDCVIGESFADIFYENALKSGLVAIVLHPNDVARIAAALEAAKVPLLTVDLESRTIGLPDGTILDFEMDEVRRVSHIEGLDELDLLLRSAPEIDVFRARILAERPWMSPHSSQPIAKA